MILILLMSAAAVHCSNIHPMSQQPSGGMPDGMEFCNQGRLKKLCQKGVIEPKKPLALAFCPGTLKKLCPIKPVALQFSSGPVSSIPVGWKVCRDNLGLCPVRRYNSRRRPSITKPTLSLDSRFGPPRKVPITFIGPYAVTHNAGLVPCKDSMGMCSPSQNKPVVESRPMIFNAGMVPCKDRMGMCPPSQNKPIIESRPMIFNAGMVPCKDRMGMCPQDNDTENDHINDHDNDSDEDNNREINFVESRPMIFNAGMVPCKDRMGMCPPEN